MKWQLSTNLTDSTMKRNRQTLAAVVLVVMAVLGLSSCIYDNDPDDRFYRTLWECSEAPLGPLQADEMVLEFMCDGTVRLQSDAFAGYTYGTYENDGQCAIFQNLVIEIEGYMVTFIDASASGDNLTLRWHIDNSAYQFSTPMHRLTSYE